MLSVNRDDGGYEMFNLKFMNDYFNSFKSFVTNLPTQPLWYLNLFAYFIIPGFPRPENMRIVSTFTRKIEKTLCDLQFMKIDYIILFCKMYIMV